MGTPEFALVSLKALCENGYNIIAAVCQPDKPKGRGMQLSEPPVKEFALSKGLPVYQPTTLRDEAFLPVLNELKPDLIIVVAYGKILPDYILDYPKYGCINVHASVLPKYRGAGPIQWSVINGEKVTGVTTMFMASELDAGDILLIKETQIGFEETAGELHDRLAVLGAEVLKDTIEAIKTASVTPLQQAHSQATYAPMLNKEIALVDWKKTTLEIYNLIRGLNPWPVCYTNTDKGILKIYKAMPVSYSSNAIPGTVIGYNPNEGLLIKTGDGAVAISEVQLQGKKRMAIDEFLRGHEIKII